MARVTVEDCAEVVQNRFELVALASQRAKNIASGSPITVERDNDKDAVVSLREIAKRTVATEDLRKALIQNHQERVDVDQQLKEQFEQEESEVSGVSEYQQEMESIQGDLNPAEQSGDELLYGEDNLEVND